MKKILLILTLAIFIISCSKSNEPGKEKDNDVFIFSSYDDSSGVWTIIRDNIYEHTKTEIKAICVAYKSEGNDFIRGKNVCDKHVGSRVSIHLLPKSPYDYASVNLYPDELFFNEGKEGQRVFNSFKVLSAKLISP